MTWVFHDSYKTKKKAAAYGKTVIKLGLTTGVKIKPNKRNKQKPFELYIVPFSEKSNGR